LPAEEVAKLEEELEKSERAYKIVSEQLAEAEDATESMDGEDMEIEKAWKKQIGNYIRWIESNLDFSKREGGKFEVEEETKKMEDDIRRLEEKFRNAASLPKTSGEAIQRPGPTAIRHEVLKYVI
jgi:tRNA U34 5-carboxymethylaminomethyl modifying GTPase MnmE/TrmE